MEKYLQQILKEVNTVIIPGLGALTIINDKSGEVMYMPYLKYDDGKLSAFISEKGNIDNDEAKRQISSYVENVLNKINSEGDWLINGVGLFSKDSNGDICFENRSSGNSVENENSDFDQEIDQVINVHEEENVMHELVYEEPIVLENEITNDANEEEVDVVVDDNCENSEDEEIISSSNTELKEKELEEEPAPAATIIVEENFIGEAVSDEIESRDKEDEEIPESNIVILKKKRGVGFFVILFFIVLVAGGGIAIGVNFKNVRQSIPFLSDAGSVKSEEEIIKKMELDKTKPTESEPVQGEELIQNSEEVISEISADSIIKEPVSTNSIPSSTKATSRNDSNSNKQAFYIVVGSFSDKQNADRAVDKLFKNGNKDASVSNHKEKFYATIANYSNIDDAISGQKSLKDSFPKSWILKH